MNQPADSDDPFRKAVQQLLAVHTAEEALQIINAARDRGVIAPFVVEQLSTLALSRTGFLRGRSGTGKATLAAESTLTAEGQVTRATLPEWFYSLPCGQQLAVVVVILLVILSVELPHEVQDQIWGLITTLGAAIWVVQRITRS